MPNPYIDNARRWQDLCEIDYFSYFIKAWIPFNAWFRNAYDTTKNERDIIELLKTDGNVVRSRITRLLTNTDEEANEFKSYLAQLHRRLENHMLSNRGKRVTLTNCDVGANASNSINEVYSRITYCVERGTARATGKQVLCELLSANNNRLFQVVQQKYDLSELRANNSFARLPKTQRDKAESYYRRINPRIEVNLLLDADDQLSDYMEVGSYRFINEPEYIFAGLMETTYSLRCLLFHGEAVPTSEINGVYEPAYHILRRFLRSIV